MVMSGADDVIRFGFKSGIQMSNVGNLSVVERNYLLLPFSTAEIELDPISFLFVYHLHGLQSQVAFCHES